MPSNCPKKNDFYREEKIIEKQIHRLCREVIEMKCDKERFETGVEKLCHQIKRISRDIDSANNLVSRLDEILMSAGNVGSMSVEMDKLRAQMRCATQYVYKLDEELFRQQRKLDKVKEKKACCGIQRRDCCKPCHKKRKTCSDEK